MVGNIKISMDTTKHNIEKVNFLLETTDLSEEDREALENRKWYLELSEDLPRYAFRPDDSIYLSGGIWVLPTGETYSD